MVSCGVQKEPVDGIALSRDDTHPVDVGGEVQAKDDHHALVQCQRDRPVADLHVSDDALGIVVHPLDRENAPFLLPSHPSQRNPLSPCF
ncbi:MAG: hypothetical protein Q8P67_22015 [archaeon]|nr:hypothetical protein [archaeon]